MKIDDVYEKNSTIEQFSEVFTRQDWYWAKKPQQSKNCFYKNQCERQITAVKVQDFNSINQIAVNTPSVLHKRQTKEFTAV